MAFFFLIAHLLRLSPGHKKVDGKGCDKNGTCPETDSARSYVAELGQRTSKHVPGAYQHSKCCPFDRGRLAIQLDAIRCVTGFYALDVAIEIPRALDGLHHKEHEDEEMVDNMHDFRYPEYSLTCE